MEVEVELELDNIVSSAGMDILSSHMILIEVQSRPVNLENIDMYQVVDVFAKMNAPGHLNEYVDIKDTFPVIKNDTVQMVYHYIIYDLCHMQGILTKTPSISLKLKSLKGEVTAELDAKVVEFKNLKIHCVDNDGDWFVPREDHTSCKTGDHKVWVYGGRRQVGKETIIMDDIMNFDSKANRWFKAKVNSRLKPKARFGHVMFCYYNYLIVFGGMSHNSEMLGDLWVYDVIKESWTPIIDNKNLLELQTQNVSGVIPRERSYASGVMMQVIGAGYMVGGINREGYACDLWALKVDKIIQHVEDPDSVNIENFWIKKEFDEDLDVLCRYGHSIVEATNSSLLIYGGINKANKVITKPLLYDIVEQTLTELEEMGKFERLILFLIANR